VVVKVGKGGATVSETAPGKTSDPQNKPNGAGKNHDTQIKENKKKCVRAGACWKQCEAKGTNGQGVLDHLDVGETNKGGLPEAAVRYGQGKYRHVKRPQAMREKVHVHIMCRGRVTVNEVRGKVPPRSTARETVLTKNDPGD